MSDCMSREALVSLLSTDPPEGLGFCGCGCPEEFVRLLRETLRLYDRNGDSPAESYEEREKRLDALLPEPFRQIWLYWLSTTCIGLLEHGGGVGGSWLTDKGKEVYAALKQYGDDVFDDD